MNPTERIGIVLLYAAMGMMALSLVAGALSS
jgi:hypothetical protein